MFLVYLIPIGIILGIALFARKYERTIIAGDRPIIPHQKAKTIINVYPNFQSKKHSDKKHDFRTELPEEGEKAIDKVSDIQLNAEKKEKIGIDRKKLIIYSEIMTPKYKEF